MSASPLPDTTRNAAPVILAASKQFEEAYRDLSGMSPRFGMSITTNRALQPSSNHFLSRKGSRKRKERKPSIKKLQADEEKLKTLMAGLNPIPFIPAVRPLDFEKHEKLLRKLCLWDFVHMNFDENIRVNLVAQLIATYTSKMRASYVCDYRVLVNRADLALALKIPLKKQKGNAGVVEVDLDPEPLSYDTIVFMLDLVSDRVLLHEDMWMIPKEIMEWLKWIKDGYPEKVDWAGLFWFMVEKELKQGAQLKNCYYASHLQHLIKVQRPELFLIKDHPCAGDMEIDEIYRKEDDHLDQVDTKVDGEFESHEEEGGCAIAGPSTELTLGQDSKEEEDMNDVERMASHPHFFNSGKRLMEEDNHISHHSFNQHNMRLRINDSLDDMLSDLPMCLYIIQKASERAKVFHQQQDQDVELEQSSMNHEILMSELQKRDAAIDHLLKTRLEEVQEKDGEIYRLERELYLMGGVLDGYKKAFKETQKAFDEYRERAQLPREATYKDTGPGGLMLSGAEIERLRRKQQEEHRLNCLIIRQNVEEAEEECICQFNYLEKLNLLNNNEAAFQRTFQRLIQIHGTRKAMRSEETGLEVAGPVSSPEIQKTEVEVTGPLPETEEKWLEVTETLLNTVTEDKGLADEPSPIPQPEVRNC